MNAARVVVIDEDPKEALPLIKALGEIGIGVIYISGDDVDRLPQQPLKGIRLVFLDMNLNGQSEAKKFIPHTVEVLERSVKCTPRVTGIVCWTKHKDEIVELEEVLKSKNIEPAFVRAFDNKVNSLDPQQTDALINETQRMLDNDFGRSILLTWEQLLHNATCDTVNALIQMSDSDDDLKKLLASIAKGAADEKLKTTTGFSSALFRGLASVYSDSVESLVKKHLISENLYNEFKNLLKRRLDLKTRSLLNTLLLTSSSEAFSPGNVYLCERCGINELHNGEPKKKFIKQVFNPKLNNGMTPQEQNKLVDSLETSSIPICVELTPACDHAAEKAVYARFLGGILVKIDDENVSENDSSLPPESRIFARIVEPVSIDNGEQKGIYQIILSARHLISANISDFTNHQALFRLREPVITDIRAWFASHAARPGYAAIH